jgi:hypothetical protein
MVLSVIRAMAQSASVSGQVADPSGALIHGARIALANVSTNTVQQTVTNSAGIYSFPYVQPGAYTLLAEAPGFQQYKTTGITVETAKALVLDMKLELGSAKESVSVEGRGIPVNTVDGTVSTLVDHSLWRTSP